jgi:GT2 family glycosyltransferase
VPPRYAIVVATRNRGAKIVPLIESILAQDAQDFELVVVDQSSTNATGRALEQYQSDPRVTYVHSSAPGASRARNLGIAMTSAPIIAITDDDCIVPRDWLTQIGRPFDVHPRVGVVFCTVKPVPDERPGLTPHIIFSSNRLVSDVVDVWKRSTRGFWLGAGMAIRRRMLADVDGFDELLGPGAKFGAVEDNDLGWRGLLRGWSLYELADVAVVHDGFRTLDEVRELTIRDFYGIGGAAAKYLRAGKWQILWLVAAWLARFAVVLPVQDVLAGRRPRGLRRPQMLLFGLVSGLRTAVHRSDVLYLRNSANLAAGQPCVSARP